MTLSDCISTATYLLGGRKELVLGERQKCKAFMQMTMPFYTWACFQSWATISSVLNNLKFKHGVM